MNLDHHDPRPLPDIPSSLRFLTLDGKISSSVLRSRFIKFIMQADFLLRFLFFPSFSHSLSVCLRGLPPLVIIPPPLTLLRTRPSCHFSPGENCLGRLAPILSIFVSERQISHLYRVVYVHRTFF
jgi:hypothetical protein